MTRTQRGMLFDKSSKSESPTHSSSSDVHCIILGSEETILNEVVLLGADSIPVRLPCEDLHPTDVCWSLCDLIICLNTKVIMILCMMLLLEDIYHRKAVICRVSNGNALHSDIHCMPDVDRSVGPELFIVNWRIGIIRVRQKVPRESPVAKNP